MRTSAVLLILFSIILSIAALTSCGFVSVTYDATSASVKGVYRDISENTATSIVKTGITTITTAPVTEPHPAESSVTTQENVLPITQTEIPGEDTATTEPATEPPVADNSITLVSLTSPISAGGAASIKIKGTPGVEYRITVYYKSGASKAAGLEPKTADKDGNVSWSWSVGSRTSEGTFKIVISGGGEKFETPFNIVK